MVTIKSSKDLANHYELLSTSYHEAAHSIYGLLHFFRIEGVFVFGNKSFDKIDGSTYFIFPNLSKIDDVDILTDYLKHDIGIKYAGVTAEKHLFKMISGSDKFPMFLREGSSEDINSAGILLKQHNFTPPGKKRFAFKKKLIKEIDSELQDNWEAITLVAHNLIKKKKLSFNDLKNILTKKTKNNDFWKKQFKKINLIFSKMYGLEEAEFKQVLYN